MALTVSIITATYNSGSTLKDCIMSVASQSIPVEQIFIDCGSTDATLEIIKQESPNSFAISEPDKGIYDALNKGIKIATGDVVGMLHADDFYVGPDTLKKVVEVFEGSQIDACYGDLLYVADGSEEKGIRNKERENLKVVRYWKSGEYDPQKFYWGWMPPNPTFFVRREVYEKYGLFNLDLGTAADYELMLRFLLKHNISCAYIPEVLVKMRVGGASNISLANRIKANRMDRKAWKVIGLKSYPWTLWMKPARKIHQWFLPEARYNLAGGR